MSNNLSVMTDLQAAWLHRRAKLPLFTYDLEEFCFWLNHLRTGAKINKTLYIIFRVKKNVLFTELYSFKSFVPPLIANGDR